MSPFFFSFQIGSIQQECQMRNVFCTINSSNNIIELEGLQEDLQLIEKFIADLYSTIVQRTSNIFRSTAQWISYNSGNNRSAQLCEPVKRCLDQAYGQNQKGIVS